jgi:hypothetical protein
MITYYPRFKVGLGEVNLKWKPFTSNGWGQIIKIFFPLGDNEKRK